MKFILSDPDQSPVAFAQEFRAVADQLAGKSVMITHAVAEYATVNRGTGKPTRKACVILETIEDVPINLKSQPLCVSVV